MILVNASIAEEQQIEKFAVLLEQMAAAGFHAVIDKTIFQAAKNKRQALYSLSRFTVDVQSRKIDQVLLIDASDLDDKRMITLREIPLVRPKKVTAIGHFKSRQLEISATSKLAYIFETSPTILNAASPEWCCETHLGEMGVEVSQVESGTQPAVLIISPNIETPEQMDAVFSLLVDRTMLCSVVLSGKGVQKFSERFGPTQKVFHY